MDTKSMIDLYLEEVRGCKDDSLLLTEEQLAELQREYQAQCQEVERLKAALLEAMEWNWLDDDAPPRFDIDNLPGLEDKQ